MKKNRILSIGALLVLAILLAACRVTVQIDRPTSPQVSAEWETAPGEYVICENFENTVTFSFRIPDPETVLRIDQIFTGEVTDEFDRTVRTVPTRSNVDGDRVTVSTTFARFASPFSVAAESELGASAIVIVPNDPAERSGTMNVSYSVVTTLGTFDLVTDYSMPVWGGCRAA